MVIFLFFESQGGWNDLVSWITIFSKIRSRVWNIKENLALIILPLIFDKIRFKVLLLQLEVVIENW